MKLKIVINDTDIKVAKQKAIDRFESLFTYPIMDISISKITETSVTFVIYH